LSSNLPKSPTLKNKIKITPPCRKPPQTGNCGQKNISNITVFSDVYVRGNVMSCKCKEIVWGKDEGRSASVQVSALLCFSLHRIAAGRV